MSKHTQGRLVVRGEWLVPEEHAGRPIGGATDPERDHAEYAHHVATVGGKRDYHDHKANAQRLAACWNAFEGIATEDVGRTKVTLAGLLVIKND